MIGTETIFLDCEIGAPTWAVGCDKVFPVEVIRDGDAVTLKNWTRVWRGREIYGVRQYDDACPPCYQRFTGDKLLWGEKND